VKCREYIDLLMRERDFRWWKEGRKRVDERAEEESRFFGIYECFPQELEHPPVSEEFIAGRYRVTIRVEELSGDANSGKTSTWPPPRTYSGKAVIDRCRSRIKSGSPPRPPC